MSPAFPANSVGLVTPQTVHFAEPLTLECKRTLAGFDIVYETYGTLNELRDNAVLIARRVLTTLRAAQTVGTFAVHVASPMRESRETTAGAQLYRADLDLTVDHQLSV